jgi:hypothetical protein
MANRNCRYVFLGSLSILTVEKENAQQHGTAQCPLKIGEELDRSIKSASDDSKTDPASDRNQIDALNIGS